MQVWIIEILLCFINYKIHPSLNQIITDDWLFICCQYKIGQLYMIAKHSHEQSDAGEGVEVVKNEPCEDPKHGKGQFTEKRVYLSR